MGAGHPLTVAVVVPATDAPATLERCLVAIRAAVDAPEAVIVVTEPSGLGPAAARNRGAEQATSEVLVFVDSDVEIHPDAFARIHATMSRSDAPTAVFGSYDDRPAAVGVVSRFRNLLHHHVHQRGAGPATTFWTGLGAVRRDEFWRSGGFDEDLFPVGSGEDIELGLRMTRLGMRIELDPGLQCTHLKRWTLTGMVREDFARRGVPWVKILLLDRARARGAPARPDVPAPHAALNLSLRHRLSGLAALLVVAGVVARRPRLTGASAVALVALNRSFYGLLLRRMGAKGLFFGLPLHVLHHLVGGASVPAGVVSYRRSWARGPSSDLRLRPSERALQQEAPVEERVEAEPEAPHSRARGEHLSSSSPPPLP